MAILRRCPRPLCRAMRRRHGSRKLRAPHGTRSPTALDAEPTRSPRVRKSKVRGALMPQSSSEGVSVAPLLRDVSLDDKYELESGRVFLTGAQAFVRLLILQRQRDQLAGLNTAGFVSGYRG